MAGELRLSDEARRQIAELVQKGVSPFSDLPGRVQEISALVEKVQDLPARLDSYYEELQKATGTDDTRDEMLKSIRESIQSETEDMVQRHIALMRPDTKSATPYEWKRQPGFDGREAMCCRVDLMHKIRASGVATTGVAGGTTTLGMEPWTDLIVMNPLRPYITVRPVMGSSFKLPEIQGFDFSAQSAVSIPNNPTAGTVNEATISITEYHALRAFSHTQEEDLPGTRELVRSIFFERYAKIQGENCVNVVTDTSGITEVNTGVAAALPATGSALLQKLTELVSAVESQYRMGSVMQVSTPLHGALMNAYISASGAALLPGTAVMSFFGHPVVLNDHFDDGDTADDISGAFGNFRRAVFLGEREDVIVHEYDATVPLANTYAARGRHAATAWDTAGISRFKTATD